MEKVIVPDWQKNADAKVAEIKEDCKTIPWFRGTDTVQAKLNIEAHFALLSPFGLKAGFEIEVVTNWAAARDAARAAARDAARDAASDAAWDAARDAARAAARDAARDAAWGVVADKMPQKNPFTAIWAVWKLGFWPIGVVNGKFILFSENAVLAKSETQRRK
jgi:hypothetical protein